MVLEKRSLPAEERGNLIAFYYKFQEADANLQADLHSHRIYYNASVFCAEVAITTSHF
jgi:hypothetical protein